MNEIKPTAKISNKPIDEFLENGKIVWIRNSNNIISCGQIIQADIENRVIFVFNFEHWVYQWTDFEDILRVETSYFTEKYINATKASI